MRTLKDRPIANHGIASFHGDRRAVREAMSRDLRIAREIQMGILPADPTAATNRTGLDVYAVVEPGHTKPAAIHRLVAARGRSLPVEVQRTYLSSHPDTPHLSYEDGWCTGVWVMGNSYGKKTDYYGAYQGNFLKRIDALFPDRGRVRGHHHAAAGRGSGSTSPGSRRPPTPT